MYVSALITRICLSKPKYIIEQISGNIHHKTVLNREILYSIVVGQNVGRKI